MNTELKYWVHYIAYIGPENEAFEGAIGTVRKSPLVDFPHVIALQEDLRGIVREAMKVPPQISIAVTVLGWTALEQGAVIARIH